MVAKQHRDEVVPELLHRLVQGPLPAAVEHGERFDGHEREEDGEERRFVAMAVGLFVSGEGGVAEDPVREGGGAGGAVGAAFEEEVREEGGIDEVEGGGDERDLEEGTRGCGVDEEEVQDVSAVVVAHRLGGTGGEEDLDDFDAAGGEGAQERGAAFGVFDFEAFWQGVEEVLHHWDGLGGVVAVYCLVEGELDCFHIHQH